MMTPKDKALNDLVRLEYHAVSNIDTTTGKKIKTKEELGNKIIKMFPKYKKERGQLNCKYKRKGTTEVTGAHRSRNKLCPCESGKKFKNCCKDK